MITREKEDEEKGRASNLSLGLPLLLREVCQEFISHCGGRRARRCFLEAAVLGNSKHKDAFEM